MHGCIGKIIVTGGVKKTKSGTSNNIKLGMGHFVLCVVNPRLKQIQYYDGMQAVATVQSSVEEFTTHVFNYVKVWLDPKHIYPVFNR